MIVAFENQEIAQDMRVNMCAAMNLFREQSKRALHVTVSNS
jgi:hypothetical protein